MIKTLTPYYIYIPLTNPISSVVCDTYTIKIYIWNGNKTATPASSSYEITKINAAGLDGTDKINIARIINDYINFMIAETNTTSLEDGNNQVWVRFECYYNDQPTLAQLVTTQLAVKGYGYFMEGENPQTPANNILLTGDEFKVNRNGFFVLPIYAGEPVPPVPAFVITGITDGDSTAYTINFATDTIFMRYRLTGDPDWIEATELFEDSSPISYTIPLTGASDVQLYAYDVLTDTVVYSNIFEITL